MNPDWTQITELLKWGGVRPVFGKVAELECYLCAGMGCRHCSFTGRIDVWIKPCERIIEERLLAASRTS